MSQFTESNTSFSHSIGNFFLFCSGADPSILDQSKTEFSKYKGIGATVFFTGVFAFIACTYALYTVFNNYFTSILFGLLWGLLIFNLDRYIVMSLKKKGNAFHDIAMALPRIILAIIISIVISKPLELKIFETEINAEITSMQQEKRKEHETLLKLRFEKDIASLDQEIASYKSELATLRSHKDHLHMEALKEADGTGGSKIRNLGKIYKAKEEAALNADQEFNTKTSELNPKLALAETKKNELIKQQNEEMQKMQFASLTGFASRIEALSRLMVKSDAIYIASLFLILLFIAIETAPLFVKLISTRSPYDYLLDKYETNFELDHKETTTLQRLDVKNKMEYESSIKNHKNKEIINAENELFTHAVKSEVDIIKKSPLTLKEYLSRGKLMES